MASRGAAQLSGEKAEALMQMDLDKILRAYVSSAIGAAPGYKALLLDRETMRTCSMLFGRSELADGNVVHIERLDAASVEQQKSHPELRVRVHFTCLCVSMPCSALLPKPLCAPSFSRK
jgi:vacuolar protein sorting-associated protein 45